MKLKTQSVSNHNCNCNDDIFTSLLPMIAHGFGLQWDFFSSVSQSGYIVFTAMQKVRLLHSWAVNRIAAPVSTTALFWHDGGIAICLWSWSKDRQFSGIKYTYYRDIDGYISMLRKYRMEPLHEDLNPITHLETTGSVKGIAWLTLL